MSSKDSMRIFNPLYFIMILIAFGALLGLLGCGSKSEIEKGVTSFNRVKSNRATLSITEELLSGDWISQCHQDPVIGQEVIETLTFKEGLLKRKIQVFLPSQCTIALYQIDYEGHYLFSSKGNYSESRSKITLTPQSTLGLFLFRQEEGLCQVKDWKLNVSVENGDVKKCGYEPVFTGSMSIYDDQDGKEIKISNQKSTAWYRRLF